MSVGIHMHYTASAIPQTLCEGDQWLDIFISMPLQKRHFKAIYASKSVQATKCNVSSFAASFQRCRLQPRTVRNTSKVE